MIITEASTGARPQIVRKGTLLASPSPRPPASSQLADFMTSSTRQALGRLAGLSDDWDGNDSRAPDQRAIGMAMSALPDLCRTVVESWWAPQVSATDEGEVTFEWRRGERKVTIFFLPDSWQMLSSWGTDMVGEMDFVEVAELHGFAEVWNWLREEDGAATRRVA